MSLTPDVNQGPSLYRVNRKCVKSSAFVIEGIFRMNDWKPIDRRFVYICMTNAVEPKAKSFRMLLDTF